MNNKERLVLIINDKGKITQLYKFKKDGTVSMEDYYPEVHNKEISDYVNAHGIDPNNIGNSKDKGFEIYKEGTPEANSFKSVGSRLDSDGNVVISEASISESDEESNEKNEDEITEKQQKSDEILPVFEEEDINEEDLLEEEASDEEISEEELEDEESDRKGLGKKILTGALATAGIAGLAGAGIGLVAKTVSDHNKKQRNNSTDIGKENNGTSVDAESFEELINTLPEDSIKRMFFENVYSVLSELNNNCANTSVFALLKDGDEKLVFTSDEIIAATIALNDYTADELYEIFGDYTLDSEELFGNYVSFASKLEIYAMNATKASGVADLISNENTRTIFKNIEDSIIDFNNNNSLENSDLINRYVAYYCAHGINGVDEVEDNKKYSSLNSARNLAIAMATGFYDANINGEYSKYLKVSSSNSSFDDQFIKNKESQVQKGEKLEYYLTLAGETFCNQDYVQRQLESAVSQLERSQITNVSSVENLARQEIGKSLYDSGNVELANEVLKEPISRDLLDQALKAGVDTDLILKYTEAKALTSNTVSYEEVKEFMDSELGPYECGDITILYNNRIKGVELINNLSDGKTISKEEWNKMSTSEQLEYAKEHGEIVSSSSSTSTEQVDKSDLTPSERTQAEEQESRVSEESQEVQIGDDKGDNTTTYSGNTAEAAKKAYNDASSYANQSSAYNHSTVYNRVNPNSVSAVPTNGSLANTAQVAYAFNNETITVNDSQIQSRLAADLANYKKTTSDSKMIEAYKNAWINTINQILASSRQQGLVLRQQAQDEYDKALAAADKANQQNQNTSTTESSTKPTEGKKDDSSKPTESTTTDVVDENDPNINPVIADSDDGYIDVYDENYDGYYSQRSTQSYSDEEYYGYIADSVLEDDSYEEGYQYVKSKN